MTQRPDEPDARRPADDDEPYAVRPDASDRVAAELDDAAAKPTDPNAPPAAVGTRGVDTPEFLGAAEERGAGDAAAEGELYTPRKRSDLKMGVAFLLPNILGFLAFTTIPLIFSVVFAFTNWDLKQHNPYQDSWYGTWAGLTNFRALFETPDFLQYFGNTLFFMIGIPFGIGAALISALLLSRDLKNPAGRGPMFGVAFIFVGVAVAMSAAAWLAGGGTLGMVALFTILTALIIFGGVLGGQSVYRTLFYVPHFVGGVATFILWGKIFNPQQGPLTLAAAPILSGVEQAADVMPAPLTRGLALLLFAAAAGLLWLGMTRLRRLFNEGDLGSSATFLPFVLLLLPAVLGLSWFNVLRVEGTEATAAVEERAGVLAERRAQLNDVATQLLAAKLVLGQATTDDLPRGVEVPDEDDAAEAVEELPAQAAAVEDARTRRALQMQLLAAKLVLGEATVADLPPGVAVDVGGDDDGVAPGALTAEQAEAALMGNEGLPAQVAEAEAQLDRALRDVTTSSAAATGASTLQIAGGFFALVALVAGVFTIGSFLTGQELWSRPMEGFGSAVVLCAAIMVCQFILIGLGAAIAGLPEVAASQSGLEPPQWLADPRWVKPSLMFIGFWGAVGSNTMLLYLAALTNVPGELYEAADIDGATPFQRFWNVTWPQLAPTTFFIVVMAVIGGLQGGFEMVRVLTQGGPGISSTTLSYAVYQEGFEVGRVGYASAVAWAMFLVIFVVTLFNWTFGNRYVND